MKKLILFILSFVLITSAAAGTASGGIWSRVALLTEGESVDITSKLGSISAADIQWSVSDNALIEAEGAQITALKTGLAIATAGYNGKTLKFGVIVVPESVTISVGDSWQLPRSGRETYAVKNRSVAKVSKKGVIYGMGAGTTVVRVAYKKQVKYINVNVEDSANENYSGSTQQSKAAQLDCADTATQIVLVEYEGGSSATVSIHEKQNGVWTQLGECSAYVGKNGIGKTKEGDKKTPTGTYNLTTPFGIKADPGSKLAYTQVTKYHYWCGRSSSEYYNQLVDTRVTGTKVTSSDEYLINYGKVYNYCMFIDYNKEGVAGKGSCIFLHCKGSNKYTAGCVAVDESFMKKIICWADTGCKIVIQ